MSSIKPDQGGGELNSRLEVPCQLIVACRDGAEMFELAEEIFDEVAGLVKLAIVISGCSALAPGRNDGLDSGLFQRLNDPVVSVVGLVGDHRAGAQIGQQNIGASCAWPGVSKNRVGLQHFSI